MNKCYQCNLVTCTFAGYDKPICNHFEPYDMQDEEMLMEVAYDNNRYEQYKVLWAEEPNESLR